MGKISQEDLKILNASYYEIVKSIKKNERTRFYKPIVLSVNQEYISEAFLTILKEKGIIELKLYRITDEKIKPFIRVGDRIFFIGNIRGADVIGLASSIAEIITAVKINRNIVDSYMIVSGEFCYWCVPMVRTMSRLALEYGLILSVVDFNYASDIFYNGFDIDELPTLLYKGKKLFVGSYNDLDKMYRTLSSIVKKLSITEYKNS